MDDDEILEDSWAASIREARAANEKSTDLAHYVTWKERMRRECEAMDKAQAARAWKPAAVRLEVLIAAREIASKADGLQNWERETFGKERDERGR